MPELPILVGATILSVVMAWALVWLIEVVIFSPRTPTTSELAIHGLVVVVTGVTISVVLGFAHYLHTAPEVTVGSLVCIGMADLAWIWYITTDPA